MSRADAALRALPHLSAKLLISTDFWVACARRERIAGAKAGVRPQEICYLRVVGRNKAQLAMSTFKRFVLWLWSVPYVRHPLLALVGVFGLFAVVFLFLNVFTEHGAEYEIPDFRGVSVEKSVLLAKPLDLRLTISDSTYNPLLKPHAVIEQYPRAGSKVKHRRRVFLTINSVRPEVVAFPRGAWEPYRTAFAAVQESKLQVGSIRFVPATTGLRTYTEYGDSVESIEQDLDFVGHMEVQRWSFRGRELHPGDSLYAGSLVDVVLGLDPARENIAEVPNVKGMFLGAARALLCRSLLNVGRISYDAASVRTLGDSIGAVVVRQGYPESYDPVEGLKRSKVPYGTAVDLYLMAAQAEEGQ